MIIYAVSSLIAFMYGITYSDWLVNMLALYSFLEVCAEVCVGVYWIFIRRKGKVNDLGRTKRRS